MRGIDDRVRMSFHNDRTIEPEELVSNQHEADPRDGRHRGRSAREENLPRPALNELDAQSTVRDRHFKLSRSQLTFRRFETFLDLLRHPREAFLLRRAENHLDACVVQLRRRVARGQRTHPFAVALLEARGVREIGFDRFSGGFVHAQNPHHHEERHHRGHEVGVRHLPRSTVVGVCRLLRPLDDDGALRDVFAHLRRLLSRQRFELGERWTTTRFNVTSRKLHGRHRRVAARE